MVSGIKTLLAHARFKDTVEREQGGGGGQVPRGKGGKKVKGGDERGRRKEAASYACVRVRLSGC